MNYTKGTKNMSWWRRDTKLREIGDLAEKIRDGEEELLEEYHELVSDFVKRTRGLTEGKFTDPLMHDDLVRKWGKEPTKMPSTDNAPSRYMNYNELRNYMRGYWR